MTRAYDYNKAWRQTHPEARYRGKARNYAQTQGAPNTGKEWTSAELARVIATDRPTDRELSAELGRSVQAIQQARAKVRTGRYVLEPDAA